MMYFLLGVSLSANAFCLWSVYSAHKRMDEVDEIMDGILDDALDSIDEEVETWQSAN